MYPCLLTNKKGAICGQVCDPFGHGAFVCKATTRTSDHNHARDILESMGQAFRFITSKEVVISPWRKKPDVQLVDPTGELLTILLDKLPSPLSINSRLLAARMCTKALVKRKRKTIP